MVSQIMKLHFQTEVQLGTQDKVTVNQMEESSFWDQFSMIPSQTSETKHQDSAPQSVSPTMGQALLKENDKFLLKPKNMIELKSYEFTEHTLTKEEALFEDADFWCPYLI